MGAGEGRVRFVGHCIGLELNEPPYLARGYEQPLEEGNVVAIEPKLAFTGLGAVGVENSYLDRRRRPRPAHGRDRGARDRVIDAGLYRRLFAELAAIGREPGGWNRMAWGPGEDAAREWFRATARGARTRDRAGPGLATSGRSSRAASDGPVRRRRLAPRLGRRRRRVRRRARRRGRLRGGRGRAARRRRAAAARRRAPWSTRRGRASARRSSARARSCGELDVDEVLARTDPGGQRPARPRRAAWRDGRDGARRARRSCRASPPGSRCTWSRAAASSTCRRRSASRPRWRRASAGAARCAATPTTPARRPWQVAATRSCPPRAPCWPRTSSRSPSPARSRPSGASARCPARPTRCRARRASASTCARPSRPRSSACATACGRQPGRTASRPSGCCETADPGCDFDAGLREALHEAARAEGLEAVDLAAYAGHDAGVLARHLPGRDAVRAQPDGHLAQPRRERLRGGLPRGLRGARARARARTLSVGRERLAPPA